jgi:hypothetical protein
MVMFINYLISVDFDMVNVMKKDYERFIVNGRISDVFQADEFFSSSTTLRNPTFSDFDERNICKNIQKKGELHCCTVSNGVSTKHKPLFGRF